MVKTIAFVFLDVKLEILEMHQIFPYVFIM